MRLKDRVTIVTGGASGIGLAIAELFGSQGARVVIADVNVKQGKAAEAAIREQGGEAAFVRADVSRAEDVRSMVAAAVAQYGPVDVLVNNAAIMVTGQAVELSEADWERCLTVDLKGAWLCSKHTVPNMRTPGASIINIASTHPLRSQPNYFPYAVAKGGLLAVTVSMAVELGPLGIRVNSLCPGFIETPLSAGLMANMKANPEVYRNVLAVHPLGRLGKPEDVAYAALFLASSESSFITGTSLIIDGGRTAYAYGSSAPATATQRSVEDE